MNQLEALRQKLYEAIEEGNSDDILKVSQELDKLILLYMQINMSVRFQPS